MCGEVVPAHPLENSQHRHVREWVALSAAREDEIALAYLIHLLEDSQRWSGQRHSVFSAGFHPRLRDHPHPFIQVNLVPSRADDLAGSSSGQDEELQRPRRDPFLAAQSLHERADFGVGQCWVVFYLLDLRAGR